MSIKRLRFRWVAVVALIAVSIYACRKDFTSQQDAAAAAQLADPAAMLDVNSAKLYYFQQLVPKQTDVVHTPGIQTLSTTPGQVNKKFVLFTKAFADQTSKVSFVELPLKYNKRSSTIFSPLGTQVDAAQQALLLNSSFDRLIIYKNKTTGVIDQKILTYLPDASYLANHHNDASGNKINRLDNDFSGYIEYKSWDGTVLSVLRILNGKGIKRFYPTIQTSTPNTKSVNALKTNEACVAHWNQDYTQTCWSSDPEQNNSDDCDNWVPSGGQYITYTGDCGSSGGGGGGGGTGGDGSDPCLNPDNFDPYCAPPTTILDQLMSTQSSLTDDQKTAILSVLNQIKDDCIGAAVVNYMTSSGKKFDWSVDPNSVPYAGYGPANNSMVIKDPSQLSKQNLFEELFHAYQNSMYQGGTLQYYATASANIEFEAKVLRAMDTNIFGLGSTILAGMDGFPDWINTITDQGASYPTYFSNENLAMYQYYLNDFINPSYGTGYANKPADPTFAPSALFDLIASSSCNTH